MKEERSDDCLYQIFQLYTQLSLFVRLQVVCLALLCSGLSVCCTSATEWCGICCLDKVESEPVWVKSVVSCQINTIPIYSWTSLYILTVTKWFECEWWILIRRTSYPLAAERHIYIYIYIYIYMSYRTSKLPMLHFIYLFNKHMYRIF